MFGQGQERGNKSPRHGWLARFKVWCRESRNTVTLSCGALAFPLPPTFARRPPARPPARAPFLPGLGTTLPSVLSDLALPGAHPSRSRVKQNMNTRIFSLMTVLLFSYYVQSWDGNWQMTARSTTASLGRRWRCKTTP